MADDVAFSPLWAQAEKVETPFKEIKNKFPKTDVIATAINGANVIVPLYTAPSDEYFVLTDIIMSGSNAAATYQAPRIRVYSPNISDIIYLAIAGNDGNNSFALGLTKPIIYPPSTSFELTSPGLNGFVTATLIGYTTKGENLYYLT